MFEWLRTHRYGIGGFLLLVPELWRGIKWLLGWGGAIDLVMERSGDPKWVGTVLGAIISPPPYLTIPLILAGLSLIYWDLRRSNKLSIIGTTDQRSFRRPKLEPWHLIAAGISGVLLFALIALGGVIWQLRQNPKSANLPLVEKSALTDSPLRNAINYALIKRGQPISRADDGSIHMGSEGPDDNYIAYWNTDVLGPWPTTADGFTARQLRKLPTNAIAGSPPTPPQKPKPHYDEKEIGEMLAALRSLDSIIDKEYAPAERDLNDILWNWESRVRGDPTNMRIDELQAAREHLVTARGKILRLFSEHHFYKTELQSVMADENDANSSMQSTLDQFIKDARELSRHSGIDVLRFINSSLNRLHSVNEQMKKWIPKVKSAINLKTAELREWKNG